MADSIVRTPSEIANDDEQLMSYGIAPHENRCAPRYRLSIPAKMRFSCSSSFPVEVTDMSLAGFACDALTASPAGTLCWLTLPGLGALEAEVVRHDNDGIGCAFKNLLNLAVFNHYVRKYPVKNKVG